MKATDLQLLACFSRLKKSFDETLDYNRVEYRIQQCLEISDSLEEIEEVAKECKKNGKTNMPALLRELRMRAECRKKRNKAPETDADGAYSQISMNFSVGEPVKTGGNTKNHEIFHTEEGDLEEAGDSSDVFADTKQPEEIKMPTIEEAFAPYWNTLYDYQRLLIDDLRDFGNDAKTRMTLFNPTTSIGKTYLIPAIAYLAHEKDCKLVYSCSTRSSIREVYKEFVSGDLKAYYGHVNTLGMKKLLLIPSIYDGYANFFLPIIESKRKKGKKREAGMLEEPEEVQSLPICTKKDMNGLRTFLELRDEVNARKNLYKSSQIGGVSAMDRIRESLQEIYENEGTMDNAGSGLKQSYCGKLKEDFGIKYEPIIRRELRTVYRDMLSVCKIQMAADGSVDIKSKEGQIFCRRMAKEEMLDKYPWVGKLYPGFLFDFAEVVLVTNKKLSRIIDPIGISRGSFIEPELGADDRLWILVDEVDQFCQDMLSESIDRAIKLSTDLGGLLFTISRAALPSLIKYNPDDPEQSALRISAQMSYSHPEKQETLKRQIIELYHEVGEFNKKYVGYLENHKALFYERNESADGSPMIPLLTVDQSNSHLILPVKKTSKVKRLDEVQKDEDCLVLRDSSADNRIKIMHLLVNPEEKPELKELWYEEFCKEGSACVHHFLNIVRQLSNNMESKSSALDNDTVQRNLCELLGFSKEQSDFVCNNILTHLSKSVPWNHFYAYGLIWNLMDIKNPLVSKINIDECNKFPDFLFANLALNSRKMILCSATANLKSLYMPDVQYCLQALVDHDTMEKNLLEEEEDPADDAPDLCEKRMPVTDEETANQVSEDQSEKSDPAEYLYTMKNVERASQMLAEKRKREYENIRVVYETYDRTSTKVLKNKYKCAQSPADVDHYVELTGIPLDTEAQKKYGVQQLAFVAFAIDSMIRNGNYTGVVYESRFPKDDDWYSLAECNRAAEAILKRRGMEKHLFKIEKFDSKAPKVVERDFDGQYVLLLSAYTSTSAGSNIKVKTKLDDGAWTNPVDLSAVFCDVMTNVIPGPAEDDDEDQRIGLGMTSVYLFMKSAYLMAQKYPDDPLKQESIFRQAYGKLYLPNGVLSQCLTIGSSGRYKKDLYNGDDDSPFKETVRKSVLQAVNRVERGNAGGSSILITMTSTLIEDAGICRDAYKNTPLGYVFGYALDQIDENREASKAITKEERDELAGINQKYRKSNRKNKEMIAHILSDIKKCKEEGGVPCNLADRYKRLRNIAFSAGYGEDPDNGHFYFQTGIPDLKERYVVVPGVDSKERREGHILDAQLMPASHAKRSLTIAVQPDALGPIGEFQYHLDHGWLGSGWEEEFAELLPHWEELKVRGYKYLPYVNMHDVFLGEFYEKMFLGMSFPDGVYDIGYRVRPYYEELLEDFDLYYEGTHVVIDVKGYHRTRRPTATKKLKEKCERYKERFGRYPIVLFINMTSLPGANEGFEEFNDIAYIPSFADLSLSEQENENRFFNRREKMRAICDANRIDTMQDIQKK